MCAQRQVCKSKHPTILGDSKLGVLSLTQAMQVSQPLPYPAMHATSAWAQRLPRPGSLPWCVCENTQVGVAQQHTRQA